jgi:hypothetical protein
LGFGGNKKQARQKVCMPRGSEMAGKSRVANENTTMKKNEELNLAQAAPVVTTDNSTSSSHLTLQTRDYSKWQTTGT